MKWGKIGTKFPWHRAPCVVLDLDISWLLTRITYLTNFPTKGRHLFSRSRMSSNKQLYHYHRYREWSSRTVIYELFLGPHLWFCGLVCAKLKFGWGWSAGWMGGLGSCSHLLRLQSSVTLWLCCNSAVSGCENHLALTAATQMTAQQHGTGQLQYIYAPRGCRPRRWRLYAGTSGCRMTTWHSRNCDLHTPERCVYRSFSPHGPSDTTLICDSCIGVQLHFSWKRSLLYRHVLLSSWRNLCCESILQMPMNIPRRGHYSAPSPSPSFSAHVTKPSLRPRGSKTSKSTIPKWLPAALRPERSSLKTLLIIQVRHVLKCFFPEH